MKAPNLGAFFFKGATPCDSVQGVGSFAISFAAHPQEHKAAKGCLFTP